MESSKFDFLTKSVANATSRRQAIRGVAAGLAAGVAGRLGVEQAEAQQVEADRCVNLGKSCRRRRGERRPNCCGRGTTCKRNRCDCRGNRKRCGTDCIGKNQCCRNNDCPDGETCNDKNKCVPKDCQGNGQCGDRSCTCGGNAEAGVCQQPVFNQNFNNNLKGWIAWDSANVLDRPASDVMTLENGHAHVAPGNTYPPDEDLTAFSRLGGYSNVFPDGGFDVSLDVRLNLEESVGDTGFAYTVAGAKTDCSGVRDFAFAVGTNNDATEYCVRFSNNVNIDNTIGACTGNHVVLDGESGWYTFVHQFRNDNGVLAVTMIVRDPNGEPVGSTTLSNAADTMDIVGGNRYAWLPVVNIPEGLDIDNSRRENL